MQRLHLVVDCEHVFLVVCVFACQLGYHALDGGVGRQLEFYFGYAVEDEVEAATEVDLDDDAVVHIMCKYFNRLQKIRLSWQLFISSISSQLSSFLEVVPPPWGPGPNLP